METNTTKDTKSVCHLVIHDAKFSSDEDFNKFVIAMTGLKEGGHCNIFAYCLLPGCAQLLLQEKDWTTQQIAEQFEPCCYHKGIEYEFEIIGDIERFLMVFRFIHQLPVRAGLCESPGEYDYSSWTNDYLHFGGERVCKATIPIRRFGYGDIHKAVNTPLDADIDCLDYKPYE